MKIVIDSSMIFSLLLGKNSRMRDTLFDSDNQFYSPNYVIVEIFEKKEKILKYSLLNEYELYEMMYRIFEKITFVNEDFIRGKNKISAFEFCRNVDEQDTPIIALALELKAKVWTGDKKLSSHLVSKGFDGFFVPIYSKNKK
jgi:predicted nucleic acid-binding protein